MEWGSLAEAEGLEPPSARRTPHFECGALPIRTTPPWGVWCMWTWCGTMSGHLVPGEGSGLAGGWPLSPAVAGPRRPSPLARTEPVSLCSLRAEGVGLACGRLRRPRPSSALAPGRERFRRDNVRIPFPPIADAQRREWDSNPRGHRDQRLSRAPLLAAQPSLQVAPPGLEPGLF